jgi:hypothetical protein
VVGELGDVQQALEIVFELDEDAEVGDLGDLAADDHAGLVGAGDGLDPRVLGELLDAEATRCFSWSTEHDALDLVALLESSLGWLTFLVQDMSEMCSRPSMPGSISMNAP